MLLIWDLQFKCFRTSKNLILRCFWVNFCPELPKGSLLFRPVMTSKMMHQICCCFFEVLRDDLNLAKKLIFRLILKVFFVDALMHSMRYTPRFCQMKYHIMIYICGKFQQYAICGCEIKNFRRFLYWFNIHKMALFWALTPPNIVWSCWNFDHKWSAIRKTQCLKNISKFSILAQMECS